MKISHVRVGVGMVLVVGFAVGMAWAQTRPAVTRPAGDLKGLMAARVEAAKQALQAVCNRETVERPTLEALETHYVWSRRVAEAEMEVAKDGAGRQRALVDHCSRMEGVYARAEERIPRDTSAEMMYAAKYYLAEAKVWVERGGMDGGR